MAADERLKPYRPILHRAGVDPNWANVTATPRNMASRHCRIASVLPFGCHEAVIQSAIALGMRPKTFR